LRQTLESLVQNQLKDAVHNLLETIADLQGGESHGARTQGKMHTRTGESLKRLSKVCSVPRTPWWRQRDPVIKIEEYHCCHGLVRLRLVFGIVVEQRLKRGHLMVV
jgi:hypothetical protein